MNVVMLNAGRNHLEGDPSARVPTDVARLPGDPMYLTAESEGLKRQHERLVAFHGKQWMLGVEDRTGIPMPPEQAIYHRERYEQHSEALAALRAGVVGGCAKVIPFVPAAAEMPVAEAVALAA